MTSTESGLQSGEYRAVLLYGTRVPLWRSPSGSSESLRSSRRPNRSGLPRSGCESVVASSPRWSTARSTPREDPASALSVPPSLSQDATPARRPVRRGVARSARRAPAPCSSEPPAPARHAAWRYQPARSGGSRARHCIRPPRAHVSRRASAQLPPGRPARPRDREHTEAPHRRQRIGPPSGSRHSRMQPASVSASGRRRSAARNRAGPRSRREQPALEIGGHLVAADGWKIEREKGIFGHGGRDDFVVSAETRLETHFYWITITYVTLAISSCALLN